MKGAVLQILPPSQKWREPAHLVAVGRFDANDFVALLGEQPGGIGAAQGCKVDDTEHLADILLSSGEFFIGKNGERVMAP